MSKYNFDLIDKALILYYFIISALHILLPSFGMVIDIRLLWLNFYLVLIFGLKQIIRIINKRKPN